MPLQIRELHIKVTVNDKGQNGQQGQSAAAQAPETPGINKDIIIATCVEKVMDILLEKMEP